MCELSNDVYKNVKHVENANQCMLNQSLLEQNNHERKINYDWPYGPLTAWKTKSQKEPFLRKIGKTQTRRQSDEQASKQAEKHVTLIQVDRKMVK